MSLKPNSSSRSPGDPRRRIDFHLQYYPKANGQTGPQPGATARNARTILQFLAVYYQINCEYKRLLEARAMAPSPGLATTEHDCLRAIEKSLIIRDGLEDQYAASGVIAEPIVVDGFTMDVKFTFGDVTATGRRRSASIMSSADVPIALPPGIQIQNLTFPQEDSGHHRGPP